MQRHRKLNELPLTESEWLQELMHSLQQSRRLHYHFPMNQYMDPTMSQLELDLQVVFQMEFLHRVLVAS
jgi:hypothetical protein